MADKIAFITGANRGLGRSMAQHLATAGIDVVGTYFSNQTEAQAAERELGGGSARVRMLQLDIGDAATFAAFARTLAETLSRDFGRHDIDYVVQNAGNIVPGRFDEVDGEGIDSQYRIHFKGPYLLNVALLPMIKRGGRILNVSSAATRFYLKDHGPYSAMKAATEVISLYMAKELGERRITVNSIAPGAIETDFGQGAVRDNAELNRVFAEATPLGRVGLPGDIGAAVVALLSDNLGWLNGQRIELTGGQSL